MLGSFRLLRLAVTAALSVALTLSIGTAVSAQDDQAILDEMLALEQGKLDAWFQNDVSAYVAEIGDETTYFDPNMGQKLTGQEVRHGFAVRQGALQVLCRLRLPPRHQQTASETDPVRPSQGVVLVFLNRGQLLDGTPQQRDRGGRIGGRL